MSNASDGAAKTSPVAASRACCCIGNRHCDLRDVGHCGRDCAQRPDCIEQHALEAEADDPRTALEAALPVLERAARLVPRETVCPGQRLNQPTVRHDMTSSQRQGRYVWVTCSCGETWWQVRRD